MLKETINISGMHCSSCALTIEKSLKKLSGVINAKANFIQNKATVEYDETKITRKDLEKAITSVGYQINPEPL